MCTPTPASYIAALQWTLFTVCATHKASLGDTAFSVAAPSLWNALPQHLTLTVTTAAYKVKLKTYLAPPNKHKCNIPTYHTNSYDIPLLCGMKVRCSPDTFDVNRIRRGCVNSAAWKVVRGEPWQCRCLPIIRYSSTMFTNTVLCRYYSE